MMREELGDGIAERDELRAALTTLVAFITVGFLPLSVLVYDLVAPGEMDDAFAWSAVMTAVAFAAVGRMKSRFVDQSWWRSALKTVVVAAWPRRWPTGRARSFRASSDGCRDA